MKSKNQVTHTQANAEIIILVSMETSKDVKVTVAIGWVNGLVQSACSPTVIHPTSMYTHTQTIKTTLLACIQSVVKVINMHYGETLLLSECCNLHTQHTCTQTKTTIKTSLAWFRV